MEGLGVILAPRIKATHAERNVLANAPFISNFDWYGKKTWTAVRDCRLVVVGFDFHKLTKCLVAPKSFAIKAFHHFRVASEQRFPVLFVWVEAAKFDLELGSNLRIRVRAVAETVHGDNASAVDLKNNGSALLVVSSDDRGTHTLTPNV
jgi:hypothetical protein